MKAVGWRHLPGSRPAGTQTLRMNCPDRLGRDLRLAVVGEVAVDFAFDIVELHVTKAGALPLGDQRHEEIAIPVEVFPRRGNGAVTVRRPEAHRRQFADPPVPRFADHHRLPLVAEPFSVSRPVGIGGEVP